ncbi:MAG: SusE domain-containing protein [Alistipes sp.]|nr:SusE domain-containing protein [Alistipes sp.]
MKRLKYVLLLLPVLLCACEENYSYDDKFTPPTELAGVESVTIDVNSLLPVVLSWSGGEANDGTHLLYDVVFDHVDGDFSDPVYIQASDLGTYEQLTLTHAELDKIARKFLISPKATGTVKWTVRASKGGKMELATGSRNLSLTRPDVLDIPEEGLYIFGTALAASDQGTMMDEIDDGIYLTYLPLSDGNIYFADGPDPDAAGVTFYYYDNGENTLKQERGTTAVDPDPLGADITVNFHNRSLTIEEHFDIPSALYLQGATAEAGQKFRRVGDDVFVIYTKFSGAGQYWFSSTEDPDDPQSRRYFIDSNDGRFYQGDVTMDVPNAASVLRLTLNTTTRMMTVDEIGTVSLKWVNAMEPVDAANPDFTYAGNGEFTLTFNIPVDFEHVDHENKGTTEDPRYFHDARYFLKVMENGDYVRWGCKYTEDVNMTIDPYGRYYSGTTTHAEHWLPYFEAGGVEMEEIVITPYYTYNQMPNRWQANWFFKTEFAGTTRTATVYTNRDDVMGLHIE